MDRQSIRETYKQLVVDAKSNHGHYYHPEFVHIRLECVEDSDMDGIVQICGAMKKIYNEVKYTREAILDITLMSHLASFSYKKIQTIETNFIYFDPKVFVQKLLDCDPETLRNDFCKVAYAPPIPFVHADSSINGEAEQRTRKRKSVHLDPNTLNHELIKVSKVHGNEVDSNVTDENNFSLNIIRIYDMIEEFVRDGHTPVYLSDVLAKAKDFSQAVDFNFCIAFLVRDGRIKMEAKSNDVSNITLEPIREKKESKNPNDNENLKKSQYQQLVLPLCYDTWKKQKKNGTS